MAFRASARGLLVGRRRDLMPSLLAFSGFPPKPLPLSTSPPPPSASAPARASRFRLLLTRAAAGRGPEPPPPPPSAEEKKSLAVRTGELFLGMSSLFVRAGRGTAPVEEVEEREGVIWEQRPEDVEAERQRQRREVVTTSPGFSFSAAGLLFPYHIGVARYLLEKGYITAVLKDVLEKFLPDDLHIRCNGRIRVAITQLSWRPRGLLVDQFDSKEDVINAVVTSSFIPGYLAPRPATFFRNRLCIDGGLTLFMPPTSASETVRICAFPASRLGLQGIGISPDCNPENRATPRQLFSWALEPAEDEVLDKLYELGYQDAAVWAEQNPAESTVQNEQPLATD
ncbi:unnamed protein product [Alopecurus aequalis]